MSIWSCIRCTSGRESAAEARAARLGFSGGWWPKKEVNALSGAKRRAVAQAKRRGAVAQPQTYKKVVPYIPGYLFLPGYVPPHIIRSHPESKLFMAALIIGGEVVTIPDEDMAKMRDIPDRLKKHMAELEAQLRAEREARRPVVGQRAVVIEGPFQGYEGEVVEVGCKEAKLDTGGVFKHVSAPLDWVERVA